MPYSQQERLIALTTPLDEDALLLAAFSGQEAISRLFSFDLDLLSEKGSIDFAQIIGKKVTITVTQADKTQRHFNGIVSHFAQSGSDARFTRYNFKTPSANLTATEPSVIDVGGNSGFELFDF